MFLEYANKKITQYHTTITQAYHVTSLLLWAASTYTADHFIHVSMQIRTSASKRHMLQPWVFYRRTRELLTLRFAALCVGRAQQRASDSSKSLLSGNKREENLWRFCLPLNPIKPESHHCFFFCFFFNPKLRSNRTAWCLCGLRFIYLSRFDHLSPTLHLFLTLILRACISSVSWRVTPEDGSLH